MVLRLSDGDLPHPIFEFSCQQPYKFWDEMPGDYFPIWETGTLQTGLILGEPLKFIQLTVEDPDDFHVISESEQGLLADLFIDLVEDDNGQEELQEAAEAVGFRYLEDVLKFRNSARKLDFDEYRQARQRFTASL